MSPASGLASVENVELRGMLAEGEIVGLGEDAPDRFRAQWDGAVFRVAAGRRLIAVAASWTGILAAMEREADAVGGLSPVDSAELQQLLHDGWAVRFVRLAGPDLGREAATIRFQHAKPWRASCFVVKWAKTGQVQRFGSWRMVMLAFDGCDLGFQAVMRVEPATSEDSAA